METLYRSRPCLRCALVGLIPDVPRVRAEIAWPGVDDDARLGAAAMLRPVIDKPALGPKLILPLIAPPGDLLILGSRYDHVTSWSLAARQERLLAFDEHLAGEIVRPDMVVNHQVAVVD